MNYKLFAFDLDGTLLNSSKEVSKSNIDALNELSRRGVKLVVCTGRPLSTVKLIVDKIENACWTVTCNGAVIKDISTNTIILNRKLETEISLKVLEVLKKVNVYFHVVVNDIIHTERLESLSLEFWEKNKELEENKKVEIKIDKDIGHFIKNSNEQLTKFIIISKNKTELLKLRTLIGEIKEIDLIGSSADSFEVLPKGVSKGNALKILSDYFKIPNEEIIAIGDNENDISMIEFAGLGIAMGNSEDDIKKISNKITLSNDEDGVAFAIYNYIL